MSGTVIRNVAIAVIVIALAINFLNDHLYTKLPVVIDGTTDPEYAAVKTAFLKNFNDGWERDGAALAVYKDGKKVVDLWGGYADTKAGRKWKEDTLTVTFSATKSVAALCVALLVERKLVSYDDYVVKYWPEFGKHGKDKITVQMILSHTAGLAWFDTILTEELAADADAMRAVIENEKPKWTPGEKLGYHAYTFGWLVDQLIRHVDPAHRSIGTFFREEFGKKYGIDFHIGLPAIEQHRVARLTVPPMFDRVSEVINDYRVIRYFRALYDLMDPESPLSRTVSNPNWLQAVMKCTINNPDYHRLEQAAALGLGNARALAKLFDHTMGSSLLSSSMIDHLHTPILNQTDFIMKDTVAKGNGLLFFPVNRAGTEFAIGHTGHGCQQVHYDRKNKLTIAYTTNGLKTGLGMLCRTYSRLQNTVYDVVEKK